MSKPIQMERGVKYRDADKMALIPVKTVVTERQELLRKPEWMKIKLPADSTRIQGIKAAMRKNGLHSVCEEASCPNLSECFNHGTATFMILGAICTRRCPFCDVAHGRPIAPDANEPEKLAQTIADMALRYVVITSVDRDDLRDGGAQHFADCISAIRAKSPNIKIETLVPDFRGRSARDMALIGQALIRDVPEEYAIYKEKEFTFNNIRQMNRNGLLWDNSLNVDGIKTGHTDAAGYNLVASATEGQMRLISAVMGGRTYKGREAESKKLLTWGFRFFETVAPLKVGKEFASEPVWFGDADRVELGVDKDVYLTIPRGRMKDLKASYVLNTPEIHAPLAKNQVVGSINFQLDGKTIDQRPLVVMNEVKEGGFFSRIVDYIKLMFHHWFG